jgi:hypothetical protein
MQNEKPNPALQLTVTCAYAWLSAVELYRYIISIQNKSRAITKRGGQQNYSA